MMGAEEAIQHRQGGRIVAVDMVVFAVVPVMEGRRGHQPLQRAEAPAQIGVDKEAPHGADQQQQHGRRAAGRARAGQAQQI